MRAPTTTTTTRRSGPREHGRQTAPSKRDRLAGTQVGRRTQPRLRRRRRHRSHRAKFGQQRRVTDVCRPRPLLSQIRIVFGSSPRWMASLLVADLRSGGWTRLRVDEPCGLRFRSAAVAVTWEINCAPTGAHLVGQGPVDSQSVLDGPALPATCGGGFCPNASLDARIRWRCRQVALSGSSPRL